MPYFELGQDVTDIGGLLQHINNLTGGYMGLMILLIVFFVTFGIVSSGKGGRIAFSVASLITAISSFFLASLEILDPTVITVPSIMFAISLFFIRESEDR